MVASAWMRNFAKWPDGFCELPVWWVGAGDQYSSTEGEEGGKAGFATFCKFTGSKRLDQLNKEPEIRLHKDSKSAHSL